MKFSIHDLCEAASLGLSQQSAYTDENKKIKIKKISWLNNSIVECQFYPYAKESNDIKSEIAFIMGFLASFFNEEFRLKELKNFAVRAYLEKDKEIMYAISSIQAADWISEGRAIEWLKNTLFEENTADHRMFLAKRQISWLENAIREVIAKICTKNFGKDWWDKCISDDIRKKSPKDISKQNLSGRERLDHTYIIDLKKIITGQWSKFNPVFKTYENDFRATLDTLNSIRRNEAHNREISSDNIKKLNKIYSKLMESIGTTCPELVPQYLVENWRVSIAKVIEEYNQNPVTINKGESFFNAINQAKEMVKQLKDIELRLQSIIIPPSKNELHKELLQIFTDLRNTFEKMLEAIQNNNAIEEGITREDALELENTLDTRLNNNNNQLKSFLEKYLMSES